MNASSRSRPSATPLSETCVIETTPGPAAIHIVGPNQSLNQSLRFFLEAAVDAGCTCVTSWPHGAAVDRSSGRMNVFLLDCLGWNREAVEKHLNSRGDPLAEQVKIVLFNIDAGGDIDATTDREEIWGIFYQDDSTSLFLEGMRAILNGRKWFRRDTHASPLLQSHPADQPAETTFQSLSPREKGILQLVAVGMSNQEIAAELAISLHTVKTHVYNIYKKIGVPNRLQAALWVTTHMG